MDKSWLTAPRSTVKFEEGVNNFIDFATERAGMRQSFLCPCKKCVNRYWLSHSQVRDHLICDGFMLGYSTWMFHGENLQFSDNEGDMEPEYADSDEMDEMLLEGYGMFDNASVGLDEVEGDEDSDSEGEQVDLEFDAETYRTLVEDDSKELYPGCKSFSKL